MTEITIMYLTVDILNLNVDEMKKVENSKETNHGTIALAVMHASRSTRTRMRVTVTVPVALFTLRSLRANTQCTQLSRLSCETEHDNMNCIFFKIEMIMLFVIVVVKTMNFRMYRSTNEIMLL